MNRSTKINWKRIIIALIVGATVASIILGVIHYWFGFPVGRVYPGLGDLPKLVLTYLIITLALAVIVGIPAMYILNRLGLLNGIVVLIVGSLVGIACVIPSFGPQPPPYAEGLFYGFGGLLMSAVFWLLYAGANKQRNTDSGADVPSPVR